MILLFLLTSPNALPLHTNLSVTIPVLPETRIGFLQEIRTWYCMIIPSSLDTWQCAALNSDRGSKQALRVDHKIELKNEMKVAKSDFCNDVNESHSNNANVRCSRYHRNRSNLENSSNVTYNGHDSRAAM